MGIIDFDKAIEALEYIRENEKVGRAEIIEKFGYIGGLAFTELVHRRTKIKKKYGLEEFRKTRVETIDKLINNYQKSYSPMIMSNLLSNFLGKHEKRISYLFTIIVCFILIIFISKFCSSSSNHYDYRKIDKGYTTDPDYSPTFHKDGQYHNNGTGDRQIQYQGSREQKNDLDAIDSYSREHPDF